jgi:thymidylate synthase (FAD)
VSYDKESAELSEKDEKLIKFLAEHKHTSPFRHAQLQFRIQCPIFVERQLFTHQIGWARNSISGRYVDFSDSYDVPTKLRYQSKSSKQGSDGELSDTDNKYFQEKIQNIINVSKDLYKEMSDFGIAKELCRVHLPLALETKFIWTGSFQAFIHLCSLRLKNDTQKETREIVTEMLILTKLIKGNPFKYSIRAFNL